ncbi:hypothetical protein ACK3SF_03445 [Candidatus Nanosalina sp. VS9-1]|uniref:hypothetical protein n=1 Tax=Candidatus Nanosalina sp. VS9-1 TaxID=3388566 RepID=UPI0039E10D2A
MSSAEKDLRREIEDLKDFNGRSFDYLSRNFYLMKSALRYFSEKKSVSFTSSRVADNFPMTVPVAASCLNALQELEVVDVRTQSSSPDKYMPQTVDLDRMEDIGDILRESREIREFK